MANFESTIKLGYYPFEDPHVDILMEKLRFPDSPFRAIDATAGDGQAITRMLAGTKADIYANEIEGTRYEGLLDRLDIDHATNADMFDLDIAPKSAQFVFANPPFNQSMGKSKERTEVHMTDFQWRWLEVGGVMVIVSYLHHITAPFAKAICQNAVDVQIYTFEDKHLDQYQYSVILARKHHEVTADADYRAQQLYTQVKRNRVPTLDTAQPYCIPPIRTTKDFFFTTKELNVPQLESFVAKSGPHTTRDFNLQNRKPNYSNIMRPAINMTFHRMVDAIAGGALDGMEFTIGERKCIIGAVQELVDILVDHDEDDETITDEYLQSWVSTTYAYFDDGKYLELDNEQLGEFIKENEDQFNKVLAERLKPRYDINSKIKDDPFKQEIFPILMKQKIKAQFPLYPAQIQVTAAGIKTLDETGRVLINGATGTGKTSIANGIIEAYFQRGLIPEGKIITIITPAHVVGKFAREIRQQLPSAEVCELSLKESEYGQVRRIDPIKKLNKFMKSVEANPKRLNVLVIARNDAKYGELRSKGLLKRKRYLKREDGTIESYTIFVNPVTGHELLQEKSGEIVPISPEATLKRKHFNHEHQLIGFKNDESGQRVAVYDFDKPLDKKLTALSGASRTINLPKEGNGRVHQVGAEWWSLQADEPIVDLWLSKQGIRSESTPRVPFWQIIQRKYADKIFMLISDEVHEENDPSSDISQNLLHLAPLADKLVGLTATITNGYADSMRLIATLFMPHLMKEYPYGEVGSIEWTKAMGVIKKILKEQKNIEVGGYSGAKRIKPRVSASPGVSVKMNMLLSEFVIGLEIDDMGKYMVPLTEKVLRVEMDSAHANLVNKALDETTAYLDACNDDKDYTYSGPHYQFNLRFSDQVFVDDKWSKHTVKDRDEDGNVLSSHVVSVFENTFPHIAMNGKEKLAIELVKEALPKGHGVGFYVQSSGGDNTISKRLKQHIEENVPDAKVCILESTVDTIQREQWLDRHVSRGYNVLITNPMIVETGLDLLYFNELYFVEPEHRLRTLEQAAGRSYRLPQTRPCTVGYMAYKDTVQESAIQLMMAKKEASAICRGRASSSKSLNLSSSLQSAIQKLERAGGFSQVELDETMSRINDREDTSSRWDFEGHDFQSPYTEHVKPKVKFESFKTEKPVKKVFKVDRIKEMSNGVQIKQYAMF
jgi:hypothetical protein